MWLILQKNEPDDYVIATNETNSVGEFCKKAFDVVDLDWQKFVKMDKRFLRPLDVHFLQGDNSKAKEKLGWQPKVKFGELVKIMVRKDLDRWQGWLNGKKFPWDAINYLNESKIITRSLRI